jgi:hypothetical protein
LLSHSKDPPGSFEWLFDKRHLINHTDNHRTHSAGINPQYLTRAIPLIDDKYGVSWASLHHVNRDIVPVSIPFKSN